MPIAYPITGQLTKVYLSQGEITSLFYHDIFEYPLTVAELIKWSAGKKAQIAELVPEIATSAGHLHLKSREGIILKRLMRKRISNRKFEIAEKAAKLLGLIPTIRLVAVTGALAMENASDTSDIDLMVVTKKNSLWTTRFLTYTLLKIAGFKVRKPRNKDQKDKLCLNIWLDEGNLAWQPKGRNIYTAHEIAQIRPLINRNSIYERLIIKNNWIFEYWPNAVKKVEIKHIEKFPKSSLLGRLVEKVAFLTQYQYMKGKITNEVIARDRALFHPLDWSEFVLQKLSRLTS